MKFFNVKFIIILLLISVVIFGGFLDFTQAKIENVILESGIPGILKATSTPVSEVTPEKYISFLYMFMIGLVGIAGIASLIWYGIVWIYSGIAEKKSEAMEGIKNTFIGIGLALGSVVILNTINPAFITFKSPSIPKVTPKPESEILKETTTGAYIDGLLTDKADANKAFNLVDEELAKLIEKEQSSGLSEVEVVRKKSLELLREKLKLELESVQDDITALREKLTENTRCTQKYKLENVYCSSGSYQVNDVLCSGGSFYEACCAYREPGCDNTPPNVQ